MFTAGNNPVAIIFFAIAHRLNVNDLPTLDTKTNSKSKSEALEGDFVRFLKMPILHLSLFENHGPLAFRLVWECE